MWFQYNLYLFSLLIFVDNGCEGLSNANFNEQIRDYSVDSGNLTNIKTLQKENIGLGRYASFAPLQNSISFKEVPDSVLSGSSHGRGLLHHNHAAGYGLFEYEDPHYNPGYEYQHEPDHHDPHDYHHYNLHDPHHHVGHHVGGYGYHHKHYDHHALAAKSLLWPIAGIALLGAAAALVSNPVLLQLGVISGRKKRQVENLDFVKDSIKKWSPKSTIKISEDLQNIPEFVIKKKIIKNGDIKFQPTEEVEDVMEHKSNFKILTVLSRRYTDEDEEKMIPVQLQVKNPYKTVVT